MACLNRWSNCRFFCPSVGVTCGSIGFQRVKHKTTLKWERDVQLAVQIDLTRNLRYIFTGCRKLQKRESLKFTETAKCGFAVLILSLC